VRSVCVVKSAISLSGETPTYEFPTSEVRHYLARQNNEEATSRTNRIYVKRYIASFWVRTAAVQPNNFRAQLDALFSYQRRRLPGGSWEETRDIARNSQILDNTAVGVWQHVVMPIRLETFIERENTFLFIGHAEKQSLDSLNLSFTGTNGEDGGDIEISNVRLAPDLGAPEMLIGDVPSISEVLISKKTNGAACGADLARLIVKIGHLRALFQ